MPFRISVIGCGQISSNHHGPAYKKYAAEYPNTELAACCDSVVEKAQIFREKFGFSHAYQDWLKMLDREKPDVVCLNVPPMLISSMTCQILRMGYPLLLEKPPGLTKAEIQDMIRTADETNVPNQVAFNRRYMPLMVKLKEMLAHQASPGKIQHVHYDFCRIRRADADFSTTAIHGIDTTRFIIGSDYEDITFLYHEISEAGPNVADILMSCTFKSGTTAQLNFLPFTGFVVERVSVHTLDHSYMLHIPIWNSFDYPGSLTHIENGRILEKFIGSDLAGGEDDFLLNGFYQENVAFFEALRQGKRSEDDIHSGFQSVVIAESIRNRASHLAFD
jgi:myo-inositol 2-dehydrogenase / D-chiro-inositol 1-dehydrogenase